MKTNSKQNNKKGCLIFLAIIVGSFVLFFILTINGVFGKDDSALTDTKKPTVQVVYDVSSLIGLNIDQIRKKIGKPEDLQYAGEAKVSKIDPPKNELKNTDEWINTYNKKGETLDISFNPHNRKVIDFEISYHGNGLSMDDYSKSTNIYMKLLRSFNIDKKDKKYSIKPIQLISNPDSINGLIITPNKG
jgi:hypothetical protein